jgi:hypothetical protein
MDRGITLKFMYRPLTLDDKIIKDGLEAIGIMTGKEPYYIVGGIATQSYLPTKCRRPTSDIDLSIVKPLNYADFKKLVKPVEEYLQDNKYAINRRKHSKAFKLEVQHKELPEEKLLIEFSRRGQNAFKKSTKKLERELEHAKNKILEERKTTYLVASPEDIAVPKIARSTNSLKRNSHMKVLVPKQKVQLSEDYIAKKLNSISCLRDDAMLTPGDLELAERLRLISDLYDIRVLSELAGFNKNYLEDVCKDWDSVLNQSKERNLILGSTLPDFISWS